MSYLSTVLTVGGLLSWREKAKVYAVHPPERCELCERKMSEGLVMFDALLANTTSWAWLCAKCHAIYGVGVGVGKATAFSTETHERIGRYRP